MDNDTLKKRPSIIQVLSSKPKKNSKQFLNDPIIQENPEPKVKERVVVEYRDRPSGCLPQVGCGCRTLSCSFFLILISIIVITIYVMINKPPFVWSEVVNYLNNGIQAPEYTQQDLNTIQDSINSQIASIGEVSLTLTQDQITTLLRSNVEQLSSVTTRVTNEQLRIYWVLDQTLPAKPLYGVIDIAETSDGSLTIQRIGTGRIAFPDFVNQYISNFVFTLFDNQTTQGLSAESIISSLFNSQNIDIKSIQLEDGFVKITADIKLDLFQP